MGARPRWILLACAVQIDLTDQSTMAMLFGENADLEADLATLD